MVPAVRGRLGKHTFYSFVIPAKHLLKIAFVNHHALNHPDGLPAYQRMVSPKRIGELGNFIEQGGFFPTNILVNFVSGCKFDLLPGQVRSSLDKRVGALVTVGLAAGALRAVKSLSISSRIALN